MIIIAVMFMTEKNYKWPKQGSRKIIMLHCGVQLRNMCMTDFLMIWGNAPDTIMLMT